jgi:hypothetical protein
MEIPPVFVKDERHAFRLSLCLVLRHLLESFSLANSPVADFLVLIAAAKLDGLRYRTISDLGKSVTVVGERTYVWRNRDGSGFGGRLHDGSKASTDLMSSVDVKLISSSAKSCNVVYAAIAGRWPVR